MEKKGIADCHYHAVEKDGFLFGYGEERLLRCIEIVTGEIMDISTYRSRKYNFGK